MPENVQEVELFIGLAGPFGDARLNPFRPGSYDSTLHGLITGDGFVPYHEATETALSSFAIEWLAPVEWENDNGDPIIVFVGRAVAPAIGARIDPDGTIAADKSFTGKTVNPSFADLAGALHSNGSTTPYFFACFGASGDAEYRITDGTWAACTGTPKQWDGCFSENGNLWVIVNGYQVRKFPAGTNPVSGTAGAAIDVGTSAWDITGAGLLGRSYVVFIKPDGIYVYDADTERFENVWSGLIKNPHADTGKGTTTWGANIYVPLGWGGMVEVTPSLSIRGVSPLPPEARPSHATPGQGRVRAMVGEAEYLWAAIEPFQQRLGSEIGLKVFTTQDGSSFNDRTSVATDDDLATVFTLNDLHAVAATSAIYIGADPRFRGPWLEIDPIGGFGTAVFRLEYWNGSAWTAPTTKDYTDQLAHSGCWLPAARIPSTWEQNAVNSVTKYWVRLVYISGAVLQVTNEVREVRVLPDVAPLAGGTNVAESGDDEAGLRTHILRGTPSASGIHWDDVICHHGDVSLGLLFSRLKAAGGGRELVAIGPTDYIRMRLGARSSPAEQHYPDVTNSFASLLRLAADDRLATKIRAPYTQKGIAYLDIHGRNFDEANDTVEAWVSCDGGTPQRIGLARKLPTRLRVEPPGDVVKGYEYAVTVALQDGSRGLHPPVISRVVAGVYPIPGTPLET